jgi:hypothetical protein
MLYSKSTDEIIRELNDFIVAAKETAKTVRKNTVPEYTAFWNDVADATDTFADSMNDVIRRITSIADSPDEITSRFAIMKVIEEIAFQSNLLAFSTGLMISRGQPGHVLAQVALCDEYRELARISAMKAEKITGFFNELSQLIFEDRRKEADEKLRKVIQQGKNAVDCIGGDFHYTYIKRELESLANELSIMTLETITVSYLEDCLMKLNIIFFAAKMDIIRNPNDKELFDGITAFSESINDAVTFFQTLIEPESTPALECKPRGHISDIAFQGNILLFYTRGETDKLGRLLSDTQRAAFEKICSRIDDFIQFTINATEDSAYETIANMLYAIHADMTAEADNLKERGGAVRFLSDEFKAFADNVMKCVKA